MRRTSPSCRIGIIAGATRLFRPAFLLNAHVVARAAETDANKATSRSASYSLRRSQIAAKEDPFAIQLLIRCADNLLIDIANKKKLKLVFSWDEHVKPEYKREVIRRIRETPNFFKHADKDHDATLGVYEIAKLNILQLGICIINYHGLFGEWTDHMKLLFNVAALIAPDAFAHPSVRAMMDGRFAILTTMTLAEYLAGWWSDPLLKLALPNLQTEIAEDLQDTNSLYTRRISDIQREKD